MHKVGFTECYHKLNTKGDGLGETIDYFVHDVGTPEHLTSDSFQSQICNNIKFFKNLCKYDVDHHVSAPPRPNKNPVEGSIREINCCLYQVIQQMKVHNLVWAYYQSIHVRLETYLYPDNAMPKVELL